MADPKTEEQGSVETAIGEIKLATDGGAQAWCTVGGAWLAQFCAVGLITAFGVYENFYTLNFLSGTSASAVSWVGSVQLFLEFAMGPLGGYLLDHGFFHSVSIGGAIVFTFSLFMLSVAQSHEYYQVLLSQGFGMGAGLGLLYLPLTGAVSGHFRRWRAFAMGVVTTGGSLGGAVFAIVMNKLLNSSLSFGWANRIAGFITLACLCVANLLVRKKETPPPSTRAEGLRPHNLVSIHTWSFLTDINYLLALASGFCTCLGLQTPPFYIQLFGELHGANPNLCFYSLAILNCSSCFGRLIPGFLADRFGIYRVYVPCLIITGVLCFGLLGCGTPVGLVLMSIFYGFFSGATISLYFPMLAGLAANPADIGKRLGFCGIPLGIAQLIGPPIAGVLVGTDYVWYKGLIFSAVTQIAAGGITLLLAWRVHKGARATASREELMGSSESSEK